MKHKLVYRQSIDIINTKLKAYAASMHSEYEWWTVYHSK